MTAPELVWKRLTGWYGGKFSRDYGTEPNREWIIALDALGEREIGNALAKLAKDPRFETFPPTPLAFRSLCLATSEELGLLSEPEAFAQAVRHGSDTRPRAPEVVFTLRQMGDSAYMLKRAEAGKAERLFAKYWIKTVEHVMAGGELPQVEKMIEEVAVKAPPEVMKKGIDDLMNMFSDC